MRSFDIIVACDLQTGGIGYDGHIPWKLSHDIRRFYEITTNTQSHANRNAVIMGRKTWESLPQRPLKGRLNIVVTSTQNNDNDDTVYVASLQDAIDVAISADDVENIFVIGGQRIYEEALSDPRCKRIYVTFVQLPKYPVQFDAFFPINILRSTTAAFKLEWRTPFYREKDLLYAYAMYDKK